MVQFDITVFRIFITGILFFVAFAGIFITIGKILNKQRTHCSKIGTINNALWKQGRPLLQSVKESEKLHSEIMDKLDTMDIKQDEVNKERAEQIGEIKLHMQKIDLWYEDKHSCKKSN